MMERRGRGGGHIKSELIRQKLKRWGLMLRTAVEAEIVAVYG